MTATRPASLHPMPTGTLRILWGYWLSAWLLLPGAFASAENAPAGTDHEARLAALEQRIVRLEAENSALRQTAVAPKPAAATPAPKNLAASPPPVVTIAGKETKLAIGGLLQVHGETDGAPDARFAGIPSRFQLRRLRVSFAGSFAEDVNVKVEAEMGNAGIAGTSGARGQLTDAFAGWSKSPELKLQVGQFKSPFGYEQLLSDAKTLFVERSLTNDRLTVGRQIGAMASGDVLGSRLNYALGLFNGNGTNTGINDNDAFMTVGRLAATVITGSAEQNPWRCLAGINYFTNNDKAAFVGRRTGYGAHVQVVAAPFEFVAEWLRNDFAPANGADWSGEGWYGYGAWNLGVQWQAVARFDHYNSNIGTATISTREWTWGVNYLLRGDDLKLSLDYIYGEQPAIMPADGKLIGRVQVVF